MKQEIINFVKKECLDLDHIMKAKALLIKKFNVPYEDVNKKWFNDSARLLLHPMAFLGIANRSAFEVSNTEEKDSEHFTYMSHTDYDEFIKHNFLVRWGLFNL